MTLADALIANEKCKVKRVGTNAAWIYDIGELKKEEMKLSVLNEYRYVLHYVLHKEQTTIEFESVVWNSGIDNGCVTFHLLKDHVGKKFHCVLTEIIE